MNTRLLKFFETAVMQKDEWKNVLCADRQTDYLNGHVAEWLPRHPQWQHWGELWSIHELEVASASRVASGYEVDGDEVWCWWWCVAHMAAEEEVDVSGDECISRRETM